MDTPNKLGLCGRLLFSVFACIFLGNLPIYLGFLFVIFNIISVYDVVNAGLASDVTDVVTCRTTLGDRSFPVVAARAWNTLPDFVTAAPSVASFSAALKAYLFSRSF